MKTINQKISGFADRVTPVCRSKRGELFVGLGIKILFGVVLGGLLLSGLYALFSTTMMPTAQSRVESLLSYTGTTAEIQGSGQQYEYGEVIETGGYEVTDDHGTYFVVNVPYEEIDHCEFDGYLVSNPEGLLIEEYDGAVRVEFLDFGMILLEPGTHTFRIYWSDEMTEIQFQKH